MRNLFFKNVLYSAVFSLLLLSNACVQEEGFGGNGTISGVVVEQTFLKDQSHLLYESTAKDENVYILFGETEIDGDDVATGYNGQFKFSYLWPGTYQIYCYGDSTLNGDEVVVMKEVELERGAAITLDTIFIKKIVDTDDGNGMISGVVMERTYNEDFSILLSEELAKDEDVYIQSSTIASFTDDAKTTSAGSYQFANLWPGTYQLYCYSDTALMGGKTEVQIAVDLAMNETVTSDTIFINKVADYDEGFASIKGAITLTNYSGSTIKDISAAQEQEVYLTYNNHEFYDERIRTGYDGSFEFKNLILGDYLIYVYSEDVVTGGTEKDVVSFNVTITDKNQVIDLGEFNINKN